MKKCILLMAFVLSVSLAFSQSFMHGAGLSLFVTTAKNGNAAVAEGLHYNPRFNFIENEDFSLSVGVPLSVGFSGSYSSNYNSYNGNTVDNTLAFMADIPVILNFNFGAGSTKDNEQRFGFFVGGGLGYHYGRYNQDLYDASIGDYTQQATISSIGPAGNAGVRFAVGRGTHNVEVRVTFMKALDDSKANIYGGGAAFNF